MTPKCSDMRRGVNRASGHNIRLDLGTAVVRAGSFVLSTGFGVNVGEGGISGLTNAGRVSCGSNNFSSSAGRRSSCHMVMNRPLKLICNFICSKVCKMSSFIACASTGNEARFRFSGGNGFVLGRKVPGGDCLSKSGTKMHPNTVGLGSLSGDNSVSGGSHRVVNHATPGRANNFNLGTA